jgi:hypothetical protein
VDGCKRQTVLAEEEKAAQEREVVFERAKELLGSVNLEVSFTESRAPSSEKIVESK